MAALALFVAAPLAARAQAGPDLSELTAQELLNRGVGAFQAGRFAEARLALERFVSAYGESAEAVLARYVPVLTELRLRYLDDHDFESDIVLVSHGAAIRLVAAVLAGVDGSFALDHHLANTESVVLAPITDGRWSCVQWASLTPPFYPEPDATPVIDAVKSETDPMG